MDENIINTSHLYGKKQYQYTSQLPDTTMHCADRANSFLGYIAFRLKIK